MGKSVSNENADNDGDIKKLVRIMSENCTKCQGKLVEFDKRFVDTQKELIDVQKEFIKTQKESNENFKEMLSRLDRNDKEITKIVKSTQGELGEFTTLRNDFKTFKVDFGDLQVSFASLSDNTKKRLNAIELARLPRIEDMLGIDTKKPYP